MDIKVLETTVKTIREEEVGYEVEFFDFDEKESLGYKLEVVYGSTADVFLNKLERDHVKIAVLDGRIIALIDNRDNRVILRDVILPNFEGRLANDNINYIKETYGVKEDTLDACLDDVTKTSHLRINPMSITNESAAYEDGIELELGNDNQQGTYVYCPSGTPQAEFFLKMAGLETEDYALALEKIMGQEVYVILCALDVIAVVNKETKDICVMHTFYQRSAAKGDSGNIKMLEDKYGITPNSLDNRIMKILKNKEESK